MKIYRNGSLPGAIAALLMLGGCSNGSDSAETRASAEEPGRTVETSGKQDTALDAVPEEVVAAAREARPELQIGGSEYEVRDGREYYDLAGTLPDGSELELDLTRVDGVWNVVEVQRDLDLDRVPNEVRQALTTAKADWTPARIIESDQGDGVIIYEFFGPESAGDDVKIEVRWDGSTAQVLQDEWLH